jgi:hypothetical protein
MKIKLNSAQVELELGLSLTIKLISLRWEVVGGRSGNIGCVMFIIPSFGKHTAGVLGVEINKYL